MTVAIRMVLASYLLFSGRAPRAEFWWWALAVFLVQLVTRPIDAAIFGPILNEGGGQPISVLVSLALLTPSLAVSVRRLHDIGKSGWWVLLTLIPIIGLLILFWFYTRPSEQGTNKWGPPNPVT